MPITSAQNPKVKQVKKLRSKREREQTGLFVIDDLRDLERALACGCTIDHLFASDDSESGAALATLPAAETYYTTTGIMNKIAYRQNPPPVIAVMRQPTPPDTAAITAEDFPLVLVLVDLRVPGNIGALLRTADATGFRAILLVDTALDIYNPNVIRSSTGACFLNNVYNITGEQALSLLREQQYHTVAADVNGTSSLFDVDFKQPSAIIMGTEDRGLPAQWLANCDSRVKIPMIGQLTDSFNVSVSGAIFMAEALRQRL